MTFQRKAWDRQLTFAEIAKETGLPENQVEVMVMRALSLGLVHGTIDQVDNKVNITWVQPRVLDKKQVSVKSSSHKFLFFYFFLLQTLYSAEYCGFCFAKDHSCARHVTVLQAVFICWQL